jgi:hypothetical protein
MCKTTTHILANAKEREKSKHKKLEASGDIRSIECIETCNSEYQKEASGQGTLANWRGQEGQVKSETKSASEGYPPPGEHGGRDKSGKRKRASKTLTP